MSLRSFLAEVDSLAVRAFPMLESSCPSDSEEGAWFLPPSQHLLEGIGFITVASVVLVSAWRAFSRQLKAQHREAAEAGVQIWKPDPPSKWVRLLDVLLTTVLFLSACTVVWHKINGAKLPYLLQPCHLLHVLLLYILSLPRGSRKGAVLLSIYLHLLSAPFLGTVAADLSCYTQRFEALNWGVQHGLLLLVPMHLLATRRFGNRVHGGLPLFLSSIAGLTLVHFVVLVPASIMSSTNINYVLCPPMGSNPLMRSFGVHYRTPMIVVFGVLAWILRYWCVDAFLTYVVDRDTTRATQRQKKESSKVAPQEDSSSNGNQKCASSLLATEGLRKRN